MKSEFFQPRFDGARFTEHTMPLDVARDLAAYETLVAELAKRLYLADHPERQRVPKGFGADFHLHLERVDGGSASPVLCVVSGDTLALEGAKSAEGCWNDYFERARDLVTRCVGAPLEQLPKEFPRDLLASFNLLGRSLRDDETMEFPGEGCIPAKLTPERRKKLVLAANALYDREIELVGTIGEADWTKSTFRLHTMDGNRITVPMPENFHGEARRYGGRHRHQVTVRGVGAHDSWDRLQKVVFVEALEIQEDFQLVAQFEELRALENGWYDGQGFALREDRLNFVAARMIGHYPEALPLPALVPTPEGNLLFEWNAPGDPSVDLSLADLTAQFHAFDPQMSDLEQEFDLSQDNAWQAFFHFLTQNIARGEA